MLETAEYRSRLHKIFSMILTDRKRLQLGANERLVAIARVPHNASSAQLGATSGRQTHSCISSLYFFDH
jgi:hypothetical protein